MLERVRKIERAKQRAREIPDGGLVRTPGAIPDPHVAYDSHGEDGDRWRLTRPYTYPVNRIYRDYGRVWITIPEDTTFDLASTPRIIWPLIAPFDLSIAAPLMHDMLYRHGGLLPPEWFHCSKQVDAANHGRRLLVWNRYYADGTFKGDMERQDIAEWRENPAYWTVRAVGGLLAWQGD